jgi:hypothetical protein
MQIDKAKHKAHYKIPDIGPKFPTALFVALLLIGCICLLAAVSVRPNYGGMATYKSDPTYRATSQVFLKLQTFSNAVAAGNSKTVSQIEALAHRLVLKPAGRRSHHK